MAMIRYSKICYDNLTNNELKEMYLKFRSNSNYKSANQLSCLMDYLQQSNRLEAVLKC